jgi:ribonuclease HI
MTAAINAPTPARRVKVFFDGGCRPNPGRIEGAVVVRGQTYLFDDLGDGTNGDAEWRALICAVEVAQSLALTDVELIGDAVEVITKANTALRSGLARTDHEAALLALAQDGRVGRLRWIKRAQNLAGIALAARHPR